MSRIIRVEYGFNGNPQQQQLSFPAGAEVHVNLHSQKNGWISGTYQNKVGWFPSAFVPPLAQQQQQPPTQQPQPQPQHAYQPQNMPVNHQQHVQPQRRQTLPANHQLQQQQQQQQQQIQLQLQLQLQRRFDPLSPQPSSNPQQQPQQQQLPNANQQPPTNSSTIMRPKENFGSCPLCFKTFPLVELEHHAAECNGKEEEEKSAQNEEKICPLCQKKCLSMTELETHAAFCDGSKDEGSTQQQPQSQTPPQQQSQQVPRQQQLPGIHPQQQIPTMLHHQQQINTAPNQQLQSPLPMHQRQPLPQQHQQHPQQRPFPIHQQQPLMQHQQQHPQQHPQRTSFVPQQIPMPQNQQQQRGPLSPGQHQQLPQQMPMALNHQQQQQVPLATNQQRPLQQPHPQPVVVMGQQQQRQMPIPSIQQQNLPQQQQPPNQQQLHNRINQQQPSLLPNQAQAANAQGQGQMQEDQQPKQPPPEKAAAEQGAENENKPSTQEASKHPNSKYVKNQIVWYKYKGTKTKAKILKIHTDDALQPFYSIFWNDREKQTDDAHLEELLTGDEDKDEGKEKLPPAILPGYHVMTAAPPKSSFDAFDQIMGQKPLQQAGPIPAGPIPTTTASQNPAAPVQLPLQSLVQPRANGFYTAQNSSIPIQTAQMHASSVPVAQQASSLPTAQGPSTSKSSFDAFDQIIDQKTTQQSDPIPAGPIPTTTASQNPAAPVQLPLQSSVQPKANGFYTAQNSSIPIQTAQMHASSVPVAQQASSLPTAQGPSTSKSSFDAFDQIIDQKPSKPAGATPEGPMLTTSTSQNPAAPAQLSQQAVVQPNANGSDARQNASIHIQKGQIQSSLTTVAPQTAGMSTVQPVIETTPPKQNPVATSAVMQNQSQSSSNPFDAFDSIVASSSETIKKEAPETVSQSQYVPTSVSPVTMQPSPGEMSSAEAHPFSSASNDLIKSQIQSSSRGTSSPPPMATLPPAAAMVSQEPSSAEALQNPFDMFDAATAEKSPKIDQRGQEEPTTTTPELPNVISPTRSTTEAPSSESINIVKEDDLINFASTHEGQKSNEHVKSSQNETIFGGDAYLQQNVRVYDPKTAVQGISLVESNHQFRPNAVDQSNMNSAESGLKPQGQPNYAQLHGMPPESIALASQPQQPVAPPAVYSTAHPSEASAQNLENHGDDDDDFGFEVMGGVASPSPWLGSGGAMLTVESNQGGGSNKKMKNRRSTTKKKGGEVARTRRKPKKPSGAPTDKGLNEEVEKSNSQIPQKRSEPKQEAANSSEVSDTERSEVTEGDGNNDMAEPLANSTMVEETSEISSSQLNEQEDDDEEEENDFGFRVMGGSSTDSGWMATGDNEGNTAKPRLKRKGSARKKKARPDDEAARRREARAKANPRKRDSTGAISTRSRRSSQIEANNGANAPDTLVPDLPADSPKGTDASAETGKRRVPRTKAEPNEGRRRARSETRRSSSVRRLQDGETAGARGTKERTKNGASGQRLEGSKEQGRNGVSEERLTKQEPSKGPVDNARKSKIEKKQRKKGTERPVEARPAPAMKARPVPAMKVSRKDEKAPSAKQTKDRKSMLPEPKDQSAKQKGTESSDQKNNKKNLRQSVLKKGKLLGFL
jgi:hypothetical protein